MTPERVRALLAEVAAGRLTPAQAEERLAWAPIEDLGIAQVDHHRALRLGYPEVVYGEGKTTDHLLRIAERIAGHGDGLLVTHLREEAGAALVRAHPSGEWNPLGRTFHLPGTEPRALRARGTVLVVAAGTSDLPVAEEAAVSARALGNPVERLTDVGVAGLHRILASGPALRRASVVIVIAGMEGALPSVVAGLVATPVIAVPTSVGYGAAFGGLAALLGMLNGCSAGITVVNIDNGFGAAFAASRINLRAPDGAADANSGLAKG